MGPLMPVSVVDSTPARFDGPPRVIALGFQLANGTLVGPRDMFDDKSFNLARHKANEMADLMRRHGPFRAAPSPPRRNGIHHHAGRDEEALETVCPARIGYQGIKPEIRRKMRR